MVSLNVDDLEVGKKYWIKYIPCNSEYEVVKITRFTVDGYPWASGSTHEGVISKGLYDIQPFSFRTPPKQVFSRDEVIYLLNRFREDTVGALWVDADDEWVKQNF